MLNLLMSLVALAALAPPSSDAANGSDIVVDGHNVSRRDISAAVNDIARPSSTGGFETQYARWDQPICVAVAGLPENSAQFMADRLGAIARDLGIHTEAPGCQNINVIIIFTNDPSALIERARVHKPGLLSGSSPYFLDQLARRDDAVRAVGSTDFVSGQGDPPTTSSLGSPTHNYPTLAQWSASHLRAPTQTRLGRMTVVVDTRQIVGVTYTQLAAYIAMASFAQIDTHAPAPNVSSILSLFPRDGSKAVPPDLSVFDQAYLRALYAVDSGLPGEQQRLTMVGSIQQIMAGITTNKRLQSPDDAPLGSGPKALGLQGSP